MSIIEAEMISPEARAQAPDRQLAQETEQPMARARVRAADREAMDLAVSS